MNKILLIEDNKEMRENTAEILELSNYKILTAKNGKEGVAIAQAELPDLIICDIMMPVLDGYGVLHLLAKNEQTANIPFIFLTAKAERNDFRKGMEMGADDYLTKPFDDIELLNAIERRLKKKEMLRKDFSKNMAGLNEFLTNARTFEDLKKLTLENEVRTYQKKDFIYKEGGFPRGVYMVVSGKIKCFKKNDDGKELIIGLYKEGDYFGYTSLLENTKYADTTMALEDVEVCMIPKEDFHTLVYNNAEVSRKFIQILSDNLREREEQLLKLAYNSVRKRVAEGLVTLYNRYKKDNEKVFSINISREDLAKIAGTAQETAIRVLSDFKEEGLVDMKGSTVSVLNFDKLDNMHN